jgi:uncharacterized protein
LKRRGQELFYYKTNSGAEVDFICRAGRRATALIQVAKEIRAEKTKGRELKALFQAMDETGVNNASVVTYEDEETIEADSKTVAVIPAYKFFLRPGERRSASL